MAGRRALLQRGRSALQAQAPERAQGWQALALMQALAQEAQAQAHWPLPLHWPQQQQRWQPAS